MMDGIVVDMHGVGVEMSGAGLRLNATSCDPTGIQSTVGAPLTRAGITPRAPGEPAPGRREIRPQVQRLNGG